MIAYGWQKSSYSAEASSCPELGWQKSSFSGEAGNCLTIAAAPGRATLLRESDDPATILATTPARLAALLTAVKQTDPLA